MSSNRHELKQEKVSRYKGKKNYNEGHQTLAQSCPEKVKNLPRQRYPKLDCMQPWATQRASKLALLWAVDWTRRPPELIPNLNYPMMWKWKA